MKVYRIISAALLFGSTICTAVPASAGTFVCNAGAIHAKAQFVKSVWAWLNSSTSDNASGQEFAAKIHKIWDGNGDCSDSSSVNKLDGRSQADLVTTHFYGDMMSVAFYLGAKDYKTARLHMDDWFQAERLIKQNRGSFDGSLIADYNKNRGDMMTYNGRLTKVGYPSTYK